MEEGIVFRCYTYTQIERQQEREKLKSVYWLVQRLNMGDLISVWMAMKMLAEMDFICIVFCLLHTKWYKCLMSIAGRNRGVTRNEASAFSHDTMQVRESENEIEKEKDASTHVHTTFSTTYTIYFKSFVHFSWRRKGDSENFHSD